MLFFICYKKDKKPHTLSDKRMDLLTRFIFTIVP